MFSPLTIPPPPPTETSEESLRIHVYDEHGYLPIHRAALQGHEAILRMILDEAQKRNELTQQLEALTHDGNEMTPLLLATAAGRLETIACLISYPVNFQAVDVNGHGKASGLFLLRLRSHRDVFRSRRDRRSFAERTHVEIHHRSADRL